MKNYEQKYETAIEQAKKELLKDLCTRLKERLKSLQKEYNELVQDEFWETARDVTPRINEIQKTISLISNFGEKEMNSVKEIKDYEQKYKEALERASVVNPGTEDYNIVTTIFPELKESEDERIRKELIDFFKSREYNCSKRFVSWLEKQGKKSNYDPYKATVESIAAMVEKYADNSDFEDFYDNVAVKCHDAIEFDKHEEKQREQKLTNKEPKFKVGDWIINSKGMLRHIVNVDKTGYQTDNGWLTHDTYEREFHLWTIQDAIDGDVLCFNDDVFILKYYILFNKVTCHCCYNKYFMPNNVYLITKEDFSKIHPATKEQRDLLFSKMEEVGYEWDAKEKKLIKL